PSWKLSRCRLHPGRRRNTDLLPPPFPPGPVFRSETRFFAQNDRALNHPPPSPSPASGEGSKRRAHTRVCPYEDRFPDRGEWEERALGGPVPFEVLDALTELVVGDMGEGARFGELLGDIGWVLRVSDINEGIEAFGQKVHLMAEPFDQ